MHSSHTLYPKMELLFLHLIDQSSILFFFFFYITKYFSLSRAHHGSWKWISIHALCTIVRESVLVFFFFLSFFRLDPLFIDWSSSRKKKMLHSKRAPLIWYFIIHYFLRMRSSRTLNVLLLRFFTYNYRYTLYNSILIYPKTWQQIASCPRRSFIKETQKGKR